MVPDMAASRILGAVSAGLTDGTSDCHLKYPAFSANFYIAIWPSGSLQGEAPVLPPMARISLV